jgi:hypothetical protein
MLEDGMLGRASVLGMAVGMIATTSLTGSGPTANPGPHVLSGSKITLVFADPGTGFTAITGDRLDSLVWTGSSGTQSANLAAHGGPLVCGDPIEFFGQAYGEPEGTRPGLIGAGAISSWAPKSDTSAKSATTGTTCTGPLDAKTVTKYTVYTTSDRENVVRITRKFKFSSATPIFNGHGLRPYVPRLPLAIYHTVLWPNADGTALLTVDAGSCPGDCEMSDWNERWFASDDGAGSGMVLIRDSKSTAPALLTINNNSFSGSNLTSVVIIQPPNGWRAQVIETEYLCFYDPTTWPVSDRAQLKLPAGCKAS